MPILSNWRDKAHQGKLAGTVQCDPELIAVLEESKCLKHPLKVVEEEREILNEKE